MDLELDGRVYVLTGATRGLGLATAEALVADGARVVVSSRGGDAVRSAVTRLGPNAAGVVADLADPAAPQRLIGEATGRWGRLDGALVSVGGPPPGGIADNSEDEWRESFERVFMGALRMVRELTPVLGPGGSIALVLSVSARESVSGLAISNGLRPGLGMLVKEAADELGPRGVRVNGLLPGRIATDRMRALDRGAADRAAREATIPLRRYGTPGEFGRVAAFILSPAAAYVTGTLIPVDGGVLRGP
jgi:3-oxoacyl-[acyl-carrier protein] reductase